jgi:hypothetical protein
LFAAQASIALWIAAVSLVTPSPFAPYARTSQVLPDVPVIARACGESAATEAAKIQLAEVAKRM